MNRFYYLSLLTLAMASCTNEMFEDDSLAGNSASITFVATKNSDNSDTVSSRAVKNEFEAGDKMLAYIEKNDGILYAKSEFTFNVDGKLTSNPPIIYPTEEINVYSFYPSDWVTSDNLSDFTFNNKYNYIPADQTNNSALSADLLYAEAKKQSNTGKPIQLKYNHVFAKFSIKVKPASDIEVQKVYIVGTKTKVAYSFDRINGVKAIASDGANPAIAVDVKSDTYAEAIVCPQTVAAGANLIKFVTNKGDKYLKVKDGGLDIVAGKNYKFDITLNANGAVSDNPTIVLQNENTTPKLAFTNLTSTAKLQVSSSEAFTSYKEIDIVSGTTEHVVSPSDIDEDYVGLMYYRLVANGKESNIVSLHSHFDVSSGDGETFQTAYIISNVRHLKNISKVPGKKTFKQNRDITLMGDNFIPLCPDGFEGTFNGQNHIISGLKINKSEGNVGLFAKISSTGYVRNIVLDKVDIKALGDYTGALAAYSEGKIESCSASGSIEYTKAAQTPVGGMVGYNKKDILSCVNNLTINVKSKSVGGICGSSEGGNIKKCGNNGNVTSTSPNVGGIVGELKKLTKIEECYNKGTVKSMKSVGGIVGGGNNASVIKNCYNAGQVESTGGASSSNDMACGIYSWSNTNNPKIENCYNVGKIIVPEAEHANSNAITNKAPAGNITNCFFLLGSASNLTSQITGSGLSDASMKLQTTYSGWDFSKVWTMIAGGYPKLKWEPTE